VAEGIEGEEVLHSLLGIGADVGQGYVIAYPLTPEQLDEYLAEPDRVSRLFPEAHLLVAGG
jgi:EAL domain-containing protein (putative c-di-GMP-specific phosphodiesterase class I)